MLPRLGRAQEVERRTTPRVLLTAFLHKRRYKLCSILFEYTVDLVQNVVNIAIDLLFARGYCPGVGLVGRWRILI